MQSNDEDRPRVGYFCSYVPRELLYAFGLLPYRILPEDGNVAAAEAYAPQNFCVLLKSTVGPFLRGAGPDLAAVVFADSCDGYRRLHDLWREYVSLPVLAFLDLPRRSDDLGVAYYADVLRGLVAALEGHSGVALAAERLSQAIVIYSEQRRLFAAFAERRAAGLVPQSVYAALRTRLLQDDPRSVNEELRRRLAETPSADAVPDRPKVLLSGSVVIKAGIVEVVTAAGAQIVAEDSCVDGRDDVRAVSADGSVDEMIGELAGAYLGKPACPRMRGLADRLAYMAALAASRQADGIICSYHKFCDMFLGEYPVLKTTMERQGLPVLLIEDDGEGALSGQARTRLEAFLEVLGCQ